VENWKDKKITVLGFGKSGASTARFLHEQGASVLVSDSASQPDPNFQQEAKQLEQAGVRFEFSGHSDQTLDFADLIIASPGMSIQSDLIQRALKHVPKPKEVICDIELAFRSTNIPVIGVTGTNGKSTTTALISHILNTAGKSAPACGNFGVPILSQLNSKHDYLVVEVSSFQLEYCNTFAPQIALWLNFTPDHLEWHGSLEHYHDAKLKIFSNQTPEQFAVINADDPVVLAAANKAKAQHFPFSVGGDLSKFNSNATTSTNPNGALLLNNQLTYCFQGQKYTLCTPEQLQIKGAHNVENALAAIAAAAICGLSAEQITKGLTSFKPLEHRLEYAGTIKQIAFYNDSKATNVSSTLKALNAFPDEKLVLIAGGKDKGTDLSEFVDAVKQKAAAVILLGEAKERFAEALSAAGFKDIHFVNDMEAAIELGEKLNRSPVVLSPACASYDMFKNYEERGSIFKELVQRRA
jgi:UDP-N-acetylmuramoylalanine--D-glutamate ligase